MNVVATRDDGALLVSEGRHAAVIVLGAHLWPTTVNAARARGGWNDEPVGDAVVPQRVREQVAEMLTQLDQELSSLADEAITAAAEVHTGAMIALVPSADDAQRIAVDGGEPAEQLHLTLLYLGEGVMIPPEVRSEIIDACSRWAEQLPTVIAKAFSVNMFNPGGDEPCVVLGVSGGLLANVRDAVVASVKHVLESNGVPCAENHEPWIPHVTLVYTDDADIAAFAEKLGSITFDHIRVAFAGDVYDIPLSAVTVTAATFATQ